MLKQTTGETSTSAIYFASELAACVIPQQQVTIDRHNVTGGYIGSRNGLIDMGVHLLAMGLRLVDCKQQGRWFNSWVLCRDRLTCGYALAASSGKLL